MRDPLYETTDYRQFLAETLRERGLRQQDLARELGLAPSTVSLALSGARPLDPNLVEPIAAWLGLDAEQTAYFAALVDIFGRSPRARRAAWATIQATQRHRARAGFAPEIADIACRWYFPVVVELAECEGFRPDPAWIAGTLTPPITVAEAQEALTTAITLGVLVPDEAGGLTSSADTHWTPPDVPVDQSQQVADFHRKGLELAAASMAESNANEREIASMVFRISEDQFERIRARLRQLEREIALMGAERSGAATRVYRLGFQLFPVTLFSDSAADHSMFARSQGDPPPIEPDTTE